MRHSDAYGHTYTYPHSYSDIYAYCNSHSNVHADCNSNCYSGNPDCDTNMHTGKRGPLDSRSPLPIHW